MKIIYVVLLTWLSQLPTLAQTKINKHQIDTAVQNFMRTAKVPGVAVAVLKNGNLLYENVYGISNLELNTPVKRNTVFELASVTKQMTAALITTLANEGKISLNDKLVKYIDNPPTAWQDITIRQLLSHMAGLQMDFEQKTNGSYLLNYSKANMLESAKALPLLSKPGTKWKYSDQGYFLAGVALEKATGQNFDTLMINRFFKPMGMVNTRFLNQDDIIPNRAQGYLVKNGQYFHDRRSWQFELTPHFGVMSTIDDMVAYEKALVKGDIITADVLKQVTTPSRVFYTKPNEQYAYGMGWELHNFGAQHIAEHSGYTGTAYVRNLTTGLTIILLTNRDADFGPHPFILAHRVAKIVDASFPAY
jgi:D-alanyl-D-alanine carboxypeptidase